MRMRISEGSRVRFWVDPWVLDKPLQQDYPRLFGISSQQKEIISNMGWFEGQTWRWTLSWTRELSLEEQKALCQSTKPTSPTPSIEK